MQCVEQTFLPYLRNILEWDKFNGWIPNEEEFGPLGACHCEVDLSYLAVSFSPIW